MRQRANHSAAFIKIMHICKMMVNKRAFIFGLLLPCFCQAQEKPGPRELGIKIGVMQPGKLNSITDVPGVAVGHTTIIKADSVRTGVTVILPHAAN